MASPENSFRHGAYVGLFFLVWISVEMLCLVALRLLGPQFYSTLLTPRQIASLPFKSGEFAFSPVLGWVCKTPDTIGGVRAARRYSPKPPKGILRVAVFGDSFVYGAEVSQPDTWAAQLEADDRRLEVLNFGVGCYGLDQALLRLKMEAPDYHPRITMLGFITDDMTRNMSGISAHNGLPKPHFRLSSGELVLVPSAAQNADGLRRLMARRARVLGTLRKFPSFRILSIAWGRWTTHWKKSEELLLTKGILRAFVRESRQIGAEPVILLFPTLPDPRFGQVKSFLENEKISFIDFGPAIAASAEKGPAVVGSHYSPHTNGFIAAEILRFIEDHGFL